MTGITGPEVRILFSAPCFVDKNAVHGKNLGKHIVFRGFATFRAKTGLLRTFKTGFDFVLSFDRFSCKTGLEPCDFFGDQILFRKFLKIATKFLTGEWHMIIMIIELSVIRLS